MGTYLLGYIRKNRVNRLLLTRYKIRKEYLSDFSVNGSKSPLFYTWDEKRKRKREERTETWILRYFLTRKTFPFPWTVTPSRPS